VPPAVAQQRVPRYRPATPTFSPYFGLFQQGSGILPNYYTFVRPEQQLRETLRRGDATVRRQGVAIGSLQRQVSVFEREALAPPTGTGSVFMDYSHYYPGYSAVGRPATRGR
jgi:hypothetical protein